jgi:Leu/Phe-tRNA-protein transferase
MRKLRIDIAAGNKYYLTVIMGYSLKYTESGLIYIDSDDDCDKVVDAMLAAAYAEEFCIALDWDPYFIARLMKAGFLVMSQTVPEEDDNGNVVLYSLVLPKLHLVRSALFFKNLHIKKSVKAHLPRYELRFNTDFETVVNKCVETHGSGWLTPSLVECLFAIRKLSRLENAPEHPAEPAPAAFPEPVSFGLYRGGELKAGEFGVICGRVYTSYSGFKTENNAGTVQMILMIRALEEAGFDFLDFGMPLDYKTDLGALDISPDEFVKIYRAAQ